MDLLLSLINSKFKCAIYGRIWGHEFLKRPLFSEKIFSHINASKFTLSQDFGNNQAYPKSMTNETTRVEYCECVKVLSNTDTFQIINTTTDSGTDYISQLHQDSTGSDNMYII